METQTEHIRARMKRIRRDIPGDVDEVVRAAGNILDWREYVRAYPLTALASAAALGYLLVPARKTETDGNRAGADSEEPGKERGPGGFEPEIEKKHTFIGNALAMLARVALRRAETALINQSVRYIDNVFTRSDDGENESEAKTKRCER